MEENGFERFFENKDYLEIKNSLFSYLNRKKEIKNCLRKNKGELILDIGSGISPVTPYPEKTVFMDLSKEAIGILKKEGKNAKVGSITKIPEKDGTFDCIVCSEVLEHVKDYKTALKEMERVLKKGGKIIITVPVHKKYWDVDDEFVNHFRRFNPEKFEKDIHDAGMKITFEKPIGSLLERKITLEVVKNFKKNNLPKMNPVKTKIIVGVNYIIYGLVKFSILLNNKENTSIMLYQCTKN